jgi:predicted porin
MKSSKKLIVAALICLPSLAFAQAEAAKPAEPKPLAAAVYGTLNVNLQNTRQQGVQSRFAVSTDSSNIGFRGTAELRHGLGATFQCETSAAVDGIGASGICNRNSRVGITTPFGTIWYGNWDTPFKAASYGTKADDPFGNTDVYGYQGIMGSPGFNYRSGSFVAAAPAAPNADAGAPNAVHGFDLRAGNSVGFHSAKFEGLSFKIQYAADEFRSANGILAPQLYGAAVNFDQGPISVFASYDLHEDAMGLVVINSPAASDGSPAARPAFNATAPNSIAFGSKDQAWRIGAGYELGLPFGPLTVSAMYEQIKFEQENATANMVKEYSRPAWQIAAKQRFGDHELRARYSMASDGDCTVVGASCSTDNYGANMLALGYAYYLAKSTQIYVHWAQITNKARAQYTLTIGGSPTVAGATTAGGDPRALGLGVRMAF